MKSINRRSFLRNSSIALAGMVIAKPVLAKKKYTPHLSFSTLGCPSWSFAQIVDNAVKYGYDGLEFRGIQRDMDITKGPDFGTDAAIARSMKMVKDKNLKIICLGASTSLHYADPVRRKASLDEARSLTDLAQKLDCPYIRIFPGDLPKGEDPKPTFDRIIQGLKELGDYAKNTNVKVLMETHADVVKTDELLYLMEGADNPHVGLVWDVSNMWVVTRESPAFVYSKLKPYIKHTHFRDAKIIDGKEKSVLLGEGEVPLKEAAELLEKDNYRGFYSFEWEKRWDRNAEDPEIAFPQYVKVIKTWF